MSDVEGEREARAAARRNRGVTVERLRSLDDPAALHTDAPIEERLSAMTRLCRAAWLATGRTMPPTGREHRAAMPGELYVPHVSP